MSETKEFYGKGNPVMESAFASYIQYAFRNPQMREAFEQDTGKRLARNPLDAMIDDATGYSPEEAFIEWAIDNHWGREA